MFASLQCCRRVETAVAYDLGRAAERAGGFCLPVGDGKAIFAGPESPLTKVVGLQLELDALDRAEARFAAHGAAITVELPTLAEPALVQGLSGRGYGVIGFEDVLVYSLANAAEPPGSNVDIRSRGADQLEGWLDVLVEGFAHPDGVGPEVAESFPRETVRQAVRSMAGASERFTVFCDGEPAAAGSMALVDGVAFLSGAATLPAFRGRGLQTALLQHRLHRAAVAGADLACITTTPGSKSKRNAARQGFSTFYTRVLFRRGG